VTKHFFPSLKNFLLRQEFFSYCYKKNTFAKKKNSAAENKIFTIARKHFLGIGQHFFECCHISPFSNSLLHPTQKKYLG